MIFNSIITSTHKFLHKKRPLIPIFSVFLKHQIFFFSGPLIFDYTWIQMIKPSK